MEISRSDLHASSNRLNARKKNLFILGFWGFFFGSDWKNFQETKQLWMTCFSWTLPYIWETERERTTLLLPAHDVAKWQSQGKKRNACLSAFGTAILLCSSQPVLLTAQQVTATGFQVGEINYHVWHSGSSVIFYLHKTEVRQKASVPTSVWIQMRSSRGRRNILILYFRQLF